MGDAGSKSKPLAVAVGFSATVAVPALLWVDTLVALARGWRPPPWRVLPSGFVTPILLLGLATLTACAALLLRAGRDFYRKRALHLSLACAALVGGWLLAEVLASLRFDAWTAFHRRPPNLHVVFHARFLFPGTSGDAHYRTNSLGVRGPELPRGPSARRVLCVGGSATECVYLDDAETWPHLLMAGLNREQKAPPVWVGSVGISGFTTAEHLQFVTRSSLMDAVDDAVFLVGFNDAGRVVIGASEVGPPPAWRRSALFLLALEAVRRRAEHRLIDRIDAFGENIRLKRLRRGAAAKTDRLPDFRAHLRDYAGRLREIARACRARGVRPMFVTQPVLYDRDLSEEAERLLWLGENPNGEFVTARRLREAMDAYNAALLAVCQESAIPCADLSEMSGRPGFFLDDCHFNEAGAREVARRLSAQLGGSADFRLVEARESRGRVGR